MMSDNDIAFLTRKEMGNRRIAGKMKKAENRNENAAISKKEHGYRHRISSFDRLAYEGFMHSDRVPVGASISHQNMCQKIWVRNQNKEDARVVEIQSQQKDAVTYKRLGAYTSRDAYQACMTLWVNGDMSNNSGLKPRVKPTWHRRMFKRPMMLQSMHASKQGTASPFRERLIGFRCQPAERLLQLLTQVPEEEEEVEEDNASHGVHLHGSTKLPPHAPDPLSSHPIPTFQDTSSWCNGQQQTLIEEHMLIHNQVPAGLRPETAGLRQHLQPHNTDDMLMPEPSFASTDEFTLVGSSHHLMEYRRELEDLGGLDDLQHYDGLEPDLTLARITAWDSSGCEALSRSSSAACWEELIILAPISATVHATLSAAVDMDSSPIIQAFSNETGSREALQLDEAGDNEVAGGMCAGRMTGEAILIDLKALIELSRMKRHATIKKKKRIKQVSKKAPFTVPDPVNHIAEIDEESCYDRGDLTKLVMRTSDSASPISTEVSRSASTTLADALLDAENLIRPEALPGPSSSVTLLVLAHAPVWWTASHCNVQRQDKEEQRQQAPSNNKHNQDGEEDDDEFILL
ncbi:hypothetical protein CEUSTIGMA_g7092.t1 [Chlamydomonas eustigma]|uniref:Uncharacterized protein n=1 Tax=Chlamydomonas eustigma TaxID=1157962 RepID=A0A250X9A7_9CHLO|nr:hypothetical protein CEUSTIGMA_g7092.t1 [Chlamydomonas eustigma]|eukprot:GAX79651.1 hypothetical protein CEUSTIGMA_g7092.t1 [Chlamydomonas eustigma]